MLRSMNTRRCAGGLARCFCAVAMVPVAVATADPAHAADAGKVLYENPVDDLSQVRFSRNADAGTIVEKDGHRCLLIAPGGEDTVALFRLDEERMQGKVLRLEMTVKAENQPTRGAQTYAQFLTSYAGRRGEVAQLFTFRLPESCEWTRVEFVASFPDDETNYTRISIPAKGEASRLWVRDIRITAFDSPPFRRLLWRDDMDDVSAWKPAEAGGPSGKAIPGKDGRALSVPVGAALTRDLDASALAGKRLRLLISGAVGEGYEPSINTRGKEYGGPVVEVTAGEANDRVAFVDVRHTDPPWSIRGVTFEAPGTGPLRLAVRSAGKAGACAVDWIALDELDADVGVVPLGTLEAPPAPPSPKFRIR